MPVARRTAMAPCFGARQHWRVPHLVKRINKINDLDIRTKME